MVKFQERLLTGLSLGFFGASFCLLLFVLFDGIKSQVQDRRDEHSTPAASLIGESSKKPPAMRARTVEVMDFPKTPILKLGALRYQILGLGQNSEDGRQIVWVRSLSSSEVAGFAEGEALFGGPVKVARITSERMTVEYRGKPQQIPWALKY